MDDAHCENLNTIKDSYMSFNDRLNANEKMLMRLNGQSTVLFMLGFLLCMIYLFWGNEYFTLKVGSGILLLDFLTFSFFILPRYIQCYRVQEELNAHQFYLFEETKKEMKENKIFIDPSI